MHQNVISKNETEDDFGVTGHEKKYPLNIKINKVFGTPVSRNLHYQGKNTVLSIITKNVLSRGCNHLDGQTTSTPPGQTLTSQIMF
jgi:hypothetical protein